MRMSPERMILCLLAVAWTGYHVLHVGRTQEHALHTSQVSRVHQPEDISEVVDPSLGMNPEMMVEWDDRTPTTNFIENSEAMRKINMKNIQAHERSIQHRWKVDPNLRSLLRHTHGSQVEFNTLLEVFSSEVQCPSMRKLGGLGEDGRWVCGIGTFLDVPGCLIYVVDSSSPASFIRELASITRCEVHVFDPYTSVDQKSWLERLYRTVHFHNFTLGDAEATRVNFDGDNGVEEVEQKALIDVMSSLGHSWLDALCADVDMDTWEWISAVRPSALPASQIVLKVSNGGEIKGLAQMLGSLMNGGFRIFNVDLSLRHKVPWDTIYFSFAKITKDGGISLK